MRLAYFCLTLLAATFLVHLMWWRVHVPKRQLQALLVLFLSTFALAVAASVLIPASDRAAMWPVTSTEWLHVALVYGPVALAYVATYSAVEEDSPSLRIVRHVADAGTSGRSREELASVLSADVIQSRLDAMVRDGLVVERNGTYDLSGRGRSLARFFSRASSWIGIRAAG